MCALYIGDQLAYIAIECNILRQFEILAGIDKPTDKLLKYGANHLTLGAAAHAAAKICGIAALTWYTAKIGVNIFISTLTFMSYCIIHIYIYIQRTSI